MNPESPWAGAFDTPPLAAHFTKIVDDWWSQICKTALSCLRRAQQERTVSNFTDAEKFACGAVVMPFDFVSPGENSKATVQLRYPVAVYAIDGRVTVAYQRDDSVERIRFGELQREE